MGDHLFTALQWHLPHGVTACDSTSSTSIPPSGPPVQALDLCCGHGVLMACASHAADMHIHGVSRTENLPRNAQALLTKIGSDACTFSLETLDLLARPEVHIWSDNFSLAILCAPDTSTTTMDPSLYLHGIALQAVWVGGQVYTFVPLELVDDIRAYMELLGA